MLKIVVIKVQTIRENQMIIQGIYQSSYPEGHVSLRPVGHEYGINREIVQMPHPPRSQN